MSVIPTTAFIESTLNQIKTGHYLALYTASPNAAGGGTEVSGGSYARLAITFGTITAGAMSNSAALTFSGLPSGTITHYGIMSAVTGGTLKVYGAINSSAVVVSGDQIQFPIASAVINLSGS